MCLEGRVSTGDTGCGYHDTVKRWSVMKWGGGVRFRVVKENINCVSVRVDDSVASVTVNLHQDPPRP